jgi:excisionase family DNA binding protein
MTQYDTYTPEEVAVLAGVTRRTVYRWIDSERLPAHKVGPKMWAVYREVLIAFMAGREPEKLHNLAASLRGRKTVLTTRAPSGAVSRPAVAALPVLPLYKPVEQAAPTLAPMVRNANKQQKKKKPKR